MMIMQKIKTRCFKDLLLNKRAHNGLVAGSSPAGPTNLFNSLQSKPRKFKRLRDRLRDRLLPLTLLGFLVSPSAYGTDAEQLIRAAAVKHGVPVRFALAIATKESGIRCGVVGARSERGPLQVAPATAAWLGFKGITKASCARQIDAGMAALKFCFDHANGDKIAAARCHNGGHRMTYSKARSVNRYAADVARLEARL